MQFKPEQSKVRLSYAVTGLCCLFLIILLVDFADEIFFLNLEKYHGVILLPEGLIESIPEVYALLKVNHGF